MSLLSQFMEVEVDDADLLVHLVKNLKFESREDQSRRFKELRMELGITNKILAALFDVPERTIERLCSGQLFMKPVYRRLLGLYLLTLRTNPKVFKLFTDL